MTDTAPDVDDEVDLDEEFDDPSDDDLDINSAAIFEGDTGVLTFAERRCLMALKMERYLSPETHPKQWETLLASEPVIRGRLHECFLNLHIDLDAEVAFKRPVPPEGNRRFPTMLHDTAWNQEETALLVYLRQRFHKERAAGTEQVIVDVESLLDHVEANRPPDRPNRANDRTRTENAIKALTKAKILHSTGDDDRLRIAPVITVLMPLERLRELAAWVKRQNTDAGVSTPDPGPLPDLGNEDEDTEQ